MEKKKKKNLIGEKINDNNHLFFRGRCGAGAKECYNNATIVVSIPIREHQGKKPGVEWHYATRNASKNFAEIWEWHSILHVNTLHTVGSL